MQLCNDTEKNILIHLYFVCTCVFVLAGDLEINGVV